MRDTFSFLNKALFLLNRDRTERKRGQSLIEIMVALGVGVLMIGTASGTLFIILRSSELAQKNRVAVSLAGALADNITSFTEANWHNIYDLTEGLNNKYYLATSTQGFSAKSGEEQITANNIIFSRYFYVENVSRGGNGDIEPAYTALNDDPSTQKLNIVVTYQVGDSTATISAIIYLTRWSNSVFRQTDWSGGSGFDGPFSETNTKFFSSISVNASSSILAVIPNGGELVSSIIDTESANGGRINTIMWQGTKPAGTNVRFQIASSNNAAGPWNYIGPDGSSSTYYLPAGPNLQEEINAVDHNNERYFRYKAVLDLDSGNTISPQIEDIIISWSP